MYIYHRFWVIMIADFVSDGDNHIGKLTALISKHRFGNLEEMRVDYKINLALV